MKKSNGVNFGKLCQHITYLFIYLKYHLQSLSLKIAGTL